MMRARPIAGNADETWPMKYRAMLIECADRLGRLDYMLAAGRADDSELADIAAKIRIECVERSYPVKYAQAKAGR